MERGGVFEHAAEVLGLEKESLREKLVVNR
jgi:hypothetical protein